MGAKAGADGLEPAPAGGEFGSGAGGTLPAPRLGVDVGGIPGMPGIFGIVAPPLVTADEATDGTTDEAGARLIFSRPGMAE